MKPPPRWVAASIYGQLHSSRYTTIRLPSSSIDVPRRRQLPASSPFRLAALAVPTQYLYSVRGTNCHWPVIPSDTKAMVGFWEYSKHGIHGTGELYFFKACGKQITNVDKARRGYRVITLSRFRAWGWDWTWLASSILDLYGVQSVGEGKVWSRGRTPRSDINVDHH